MNRVFKKAIIIAPIVTVVSSVGIFLGAAANRKKTIPSTASNELTISENPDLALNFQDIYPELYQEEFYNFLKVKDGEGYIDDDFISTVLQKVIAGLKITSGSVEWGFNYIDHFRKEVEINFVWHPQNSGEDIKKSYIFKVS